MIEVSGLTKVYPSGCKAIDNLSLTIRQGEIFALLGPNGAGKTSTIRVLSTLAGFDEGSVVVAGHNVDTAPQQVRSAIGFVGQQTGVDNFLTGRENLMLHGQLYRIDRATLRRRVEELSGYFSLSDSLDAPVMTYSGGMRRKLDIAVSLIHSPRVLFLDEPTLGLDIGSRKSLWQLIQRLNGELQLTILLTTHYLEEADHLAHRVGIINAGRIQVADTPEALKDAIRGDAVVLVFESPAQAHEGLVRDLQDQPYVRDAVWEHNNLRLYLDNAAANVAPIMQLAATHGVLVKTLSLSRPTLDDVFIKYTGTSLESGAAEPAQEWWTQWAGKGGSWGQSKQWQKWAGAGEGDGDVAGEGEQPAGDKAAGAAGSGDAHSDWQRWAGGGATGEAPQGGAGQDQGWSQWSDPQGGGPAAGGWSGEAAQWPDKAAEQPAADTSEGGAPAPGAWPDADRRQKDKPNKP